MIFYLIPTLTHVHHSLHGRCLFPRQSASLSLPAHGNGRFHNWWLSHPLKNISQVRLDHHPKSWGKWKTTCSKTTNQITIIFPLLLIYTLLTTINITITIVGWWLSHPLKNMSSSDWIIIPTLGENKINVPNHQPVLVSSYPYPVTLW